MRFIQLFLGVVGVGAVTAIGATGCSSSSATTTTTGGTGAGSTASATTGTAPAGCAPKASCDAVDKTCIGLVDNSTKTKFGLRMAELDVTSPAALTSGVVKTTVAGNVTQNDMSCNLLGSGTFTWLLQFDTAAGTLKTGGAKPVTSPAAGYAFDEEMVMQGTQTFSLAPVTYMTKPDATGNFSVATGQDLIVPIFLNATASSYVLLPLKQARIKSGTLSKSQNCIGTYNAAGLDPANSCQPDDTVTPPIPQFNDGGSLDGYILLTDADGVVVSAIGQTLCVLLSGNATMYGDGASPTQACKKDSSGKIVYQGHWCSTTNSAATATCADSEQLAANFAASSILITN